MGSGDTQRFGPYIILDRVGDGGMAEIFLAKMTGYSGFEKLIALKKILPRFSQDHAFSQLLIREAKLAALLLHFNITQVLDLGEIEGQVYIAMEYVRGKDLAAVLSAAYRKKERLPVGLSLFIATEFITGLDYAHRMHGADGRPLGIIHRDISPQNILISYEGEVKVTDFGIARALDREKEGPVAPNNLHGKFGYMSPELLRGEKIDQRADIFSAGVVLYEMLTGTRLFRGKDQNETVQLILGGRYPRPSATNPEVPPSVDRIVAKALESKVADRYQTTGALLGDIGQISDSLPRRSTSRDLSVFMRRTYGDANQAKPMRPGRADSQIQFAAPAKGPDGRKLLLGEILINQGAITPTDLEIALAEQRARGGRIGTILSLAGLISDDALLRALSLQSELTVISDEDLEHHPPPRELLKRLPAEMARSKLVIPLSDVDADGSVRLAIADPTDDRSIQAVRTALGAKSVVSFLAKASKLASVIEDWYDEDAPTPEPIPEKTPAPPVAVNPKPPIVLIADGDMTSIEALVLRVREEDCQVVVVDDGRRAKIAFEVCAPAVALLDAALPRIDGYNLLLELRAAGCESAIFITSTRGDDARQAKALELGADDFLVKPFSLELATSKIRRELQKRARRARSASTAGERTPVAERTPTPSPWMFPPAPTPGASLMPVPPIPPSAPPVRSEEREAPRAITKTPLPGAQSASATPPAAAMPAVARTPTPPPASAAATPAPSAAPAAPATRTASAPPPAPARSATPAATASSSGLPAMPPPSMPLPAVPPLIPGGLKLTELESRFMKSFVPSPPPAPPADPAPSDSLLAPAMPAVAPIEVAPAKVSSSWSELVPQILPSPRSSSSVGRSAPRVPLDPANQPENPPPRTAPPDLPAKPEAKQTLVAGAAAPAVPPAPLEAAATTPASPAEDSTPASDATPTPTPNGEEQVFSVLSDDLFLSPKGRSNLVERVEGNISDPASRGEE